MRTLKIAAVAIALAGCGDLVEKGDQPAPPAPPSSTLQPPSASLRETLREARAYAAFGDRIWKGYAASPFDALLVESERETLFCRKESVAGFEALGDDPITGCSMQGRARTFNTGLLASFSAFGPEETIVIGTPETTGLDPLAWSLTLLHEHFHQHQATMPDYNARIAALDLAGDDDTGMWMLNYPFPYESAEVGAAFTTFASALEAAAAAIGSPEAPAARAAYLDAREAFRASVSEADWRYLEFQLWKEGVARWTEIAAAEASGDPALNAWAADRRASVRAQLQEVQEKGLNSFKRTIFYAVGASEAMLLEAEGEGWRTRYFAEPFALGPLFE
ncbi:MAG: hypothetical protein RIE56_12720 [Amphiplicatus sp.]